MIKIIDATLSLLDDFCIEKEEMYNFIRLLGEIGLKDIQISVNAYYVMEGELPEGYRYYVNVDTASYMQDRYPKEDKNIVCFFTPKQRKSSREIVTLHVNDLEEPRRLHGVHAGETIKLVGLDNMLLGGCEVGFTTMKKKFPEARIILSAENTFCSATAISVMFLQRKGYAVVTSVLGVGNKAATEQVLMALHVMDRYLVSQKFEVFVEIKKWMEMHAKERVSPFAPVFGEKIFCVESGVHVDGILKKPTNYEAYPPEKVGLSREIILGKHSGRSSILHTIERLNPGSKGKEHLDEILEEVKWMSKWTEQSVSDEEFLKILERYE